LKAAWKWIVGVLVAISAVGAALFGRDVIAAAERRGRRKEHKRQVRMREGVVAKLKANDSAEDTKHAERIAKIDRDVAASLAHDPSDADFDRLMREYAP
jgi:hypothetical protein